MVAVGPFLPKLRRFLRISVRADGPAGQICVLKHFFWGGAGFTNSRIWKMNLDSIRVHWGPWASWHAKVKTNDSSLSNGGPSIVGMDFTLRPLNFDGVIGIKLSIWYVLTPKYNVASANEIQVGHIMFPSTWGSYQWIMSPFNTVVSNLGGKLLSTQWLGRRGIHFVDIPCWESTIDQPTLHMDHYNVVIFLTASQPEMALLRHLHQKTNLTSQTHHASPPRKVLVGAWKMSCHSLSPRSILVDVLFS